MLAKFIGKDDSMGFKNGVTYESFIENWNISEN